jgi:hypothetical protein
VGASGRAHNGLSSLLMQHMAENKGKHPSGAKAFIHFATFGGTTKVVPFQNGVPIWISAR